MCGEVFRDSGIVGGSGWGIDDGAIMGVLVMKGPRLTRKRKVAPAQSRSQPLRFNLRLKTKKFVW